MATPEYASVEHLSRGSKDLLELPFHEGRATLEG
jgi:hypothetical protein